MTVSSRRAGAAGEPEPLDPYRAQHLAAQPRDTVHAGARVRVLVDEAESPLAWLARRKGRDGHALIAPEQFQAGERLRADFTRAQLSPRVTANWDATATPGKGAGRSPAEMSDAVLAAKQRLRAAIEAAGPEFSGLLLDVCCFLKGLEDAERDRRWPPRSAKIVLQLGLDRLARHYGLSRAAHGPARSAMRAWASDAPVGEAAANDALGDDVRS